VPRKFLERKGMRRKHSWKEELRPSFLSADQRLQFFRMRRIVKK
jgi:hypothetical protein